MAEQKKIWVSVPDNLLKEIDLIVSMEKINRSEFIREATKFYIREKRKIFLRDMMKKGYKQMAEINLKISNECFIADYDQYQKYEQRLRELEAK